MKIITRAVLSMNTMQWVTELEESYSYEGPIALCDRWGSAAAKANEHNDVNLENKYGAQSDTDRSQLSPFYTNEMHATHGFTPGQTGELLDYAEAGTGGATSGITGQAGLEAARTRNASGFTKSLDEAARDESKARAGASEGIAAQDIMGAKELNQEGAAGMQGLYGVDTKGQLGAMGQATADEQAAVEAGKSGWYQNLLAGVNTAANVVKAYKSGSGGNGGGTT